MKDCGLRLAFGAPKPISTNFLTYLLWYMRKSLIEDSAIWFTWLVGLLFSFGY